MIQFFTENLIWTEGIYILVVLLILFFVSFFIHRFWIFVSIILIGFSFFFFRNPERLCFYDENSLVSPADGTILSILKSEGLFEGFDQKISIFLSVWDVHVNWIPSQGIVTNITYKPGKFFLAFLDKGSELNEHNDVYIKDKFGHHILIRQIAGFIARRISCWIKPGDLVMSCEKYGMIKFGSRIEIFLSKEFNIQVKEGEHVFGGQTILGNWKK